MGLLYVRTGNTGTDPDFLIEDLGFNIPTGASWTLLAASSPDDADGNSGLFSARDIRDSADLFENVRNGNLEWSEDGSTVAVAGDYVSDYMLTQDFTDDFFNLTDGRLAIPTGSSTPGTGDSGDVFWDTDDEQLYVHDGSDWQDISTIISGVLDHDALNGLGDDDHTQYHNDARGDARYYREDEHIDTSTGASDSGKPVVLNVSGLIDDSMLDIEADEVGFDPTGLPTNVTNVQDAIENLYNVSDVTNEPTGFPNRTDSTYSFADGSRTFTIQPAVTSFDYYLEGEKVIVSSSKSVVIDDTEGMWYIYFDDNTATLQATQTFSIDIIYEYAYVAALYWDADNNTAILIGDERHGIVMDGATHAYLHLTQGTAFESGLALGNMTVDDDGSDNSHAQFLVSDGVIRDEDIRLAINDGSPQDLDPIANLPVFYREGSSADWRKVDATTFPLIYNGNLADYTDTRIGYNEDTGSTWQLTEVAASGLMLMHVFATNDLDEPMIAVVGQETYADVGTARSGAEVEINALATDGLPFQEFLAVATVIYQSADDYTNTPKARIISTAEGDDYIDWRFDDVNPEGGTSTSDHGNLSGLGDDDHSQYLLLSGNAGRNPVTGKIDVSGGELTLPQATDVPSTFTSANEGDVAWDSDDDTFWVYDGTTWVTIGSPSVSGLISDHGILTGLADDDHPQYLNETRHDALPADNPHSVTFTQAVTADGGTDILASEAEILTDGSNADGLHVHDHGALTGLEDDDHTQYLDLNGDENRNEVSGVVNIKNGDIILPNTTDVSGETVINEGQVYWDTDDDQLYIYNGTEWVDIASIVSGVLEHGNLDGLNDDDHSQYGLLAGSASRNPVTGKYNFAGGELRLPQSANVAAAFPSAEEGDIAWDTDDEALYMYDGTQWITVATSSGVNNDHGALTGLNDDDHLQYLTEARHDALPADNPHAVTFTQAVSADGGTDISAAEAEILTDGSNADSLHTHDHGNLIGIDDDDHDQYLLLDGDENRNTVSGVVNIEEGDLILPNTTNVNGETVINEGQVYWDSAADMLYIWDGSAWLDIPAVLSGVQTHGTLVGLGDDDHSQYLLIDGDNTRNAVTGTVNLSGADKFSLPQATDVPGTLTGTEGALAWDTDDDVLYAHDGTNWFGIAPASGIVTDHGALDNLDQDHHPQYTEWNNTETVSGLWTFDTANTDPNLILDPRPTAPTNNTDGGLAIIDDMLYTYDATRGKWLSVDREQLHASKFGNAKNIYLRVADGIASSQTGYRVLRDATITAIIAQTDNTESWTLEVRKNGGASPIVTLVMSAVQGNQDITLNINVDQGDELQFYANVSGSAIKAPIAGIELAWRK